jgi:carboxylate-amine ligase
LETESIREHTEIWWTVRPHQSFGTVEIRACDALPDIADSIALAAFQVALTARAARLYDTGELPPATRPSDIEENLWRAQRHGLEGTMIDFERGEERTTADAVRALVDFTAPVHDRLGLGPFLEGIPVMLEHGNGAQRQAREFTSGGDLVAMHASAAERTRRSAEEALELIGMVSTT